MKTAILGYNVEGQSSYEYFKGLGHELTILDANPELQVPEGARSVLGEKYLDGLDRFDLIVRTPGLTPRIILDKNPSVTGKITTHINEFLKACPTKNVIGVTGTKGKGTTSSLIAEMLKASGNDVHLGGNIGVAPLSFLNMLSIDSWVVLELSSFQLIDLKSSPRIGVCLMVVPEHLDWHSDIDEYVEAKSNLFARQSSDDIAVYFAGNETSKRIVSAGQGRKIPYYAPPGAYVENDAVMLDGHEICMTAELKLLGKHNWQNVCAAVTAVAQVPVNTDAVRSVLTSFSGLEHRLQLVRELDGIAYYDDSFGTTPETAKVAIEAFDQPKVIILGGADKGASYNELAGAVADSNVRAAILIGDQAAKIQTSLEKTGFTNFVSGGNNMTDIVNVARRKAESGDVVLLSTACASFDMFKNYKDRGEQFTAAVQALS